MLICLKFIPFMPVAICYATVAVMEQKARENRIDRVLGSGILVINLEMRENGYQLVTNLYVEDWDLGMDDRDRDHPIYRVYLQQYDSDDFRVRNEMREDKAKFGGGEPRPKKEGTPGFIQNSGPQIALY
ncbi:hypothetical protein RHSIM_Rhsim04G0062700 [Rhododendron simsii]|uniref:Uncharacterized protein n=1 Tax=Rhododendron simsii TaxID=118357 RepID=A0A834H4U0_RHOSS|nr:hypothetical protein RHSIM_Rhsim04G0062700 [Rhododendron simsii]